MNLELIRQNNSGEMKFVKHSLVSQMIHTTKLLFDGQEYVEALQICYELSQLEPLNVLVYEQYIEIIQHVFINGLDCMKFGETLPENTHKEYIVFHTDKAIRMFMGLLDDQNTNHLNDLTNQCLVITLAVDEQINDMLTDIEMIAKEYMICVSLRLNNRLMLLDILNARFEELEDEVNGVKDF